MGALLDEPAVVLVALSAAAVLVVVEVALPTAGIAGTLALLLGVAVAVGIDRQDALWWPLLGPMVAVGLWAVMIARRSRSAALERSAVALSGAGSLGFGLAENSAVTAALGVFVAAAVAAGFPVLHRSALGLLGRPAQVGMESLLGAHGQVLAWSGHSGTVLLQGSRWAATAADALEVSDDVQVIDFSGMTVEVARPIQRQR